MAQMQIDKTNRKNLLYSRPVILLLVIVVVIFALSVFDIFIKYRETSKNRNNAEQELQTLKIKETDLNGEIIKLNSDSGIESVIRENYPVVKEGEGVILITDNPVPKSASENTDNKFINFLKNVFGKKK